jgi:hypothetical protein
LSLEGIISNEVGTPLHMYYVMKGLP